MYAFEYHRPSSLDEAVALLTSDDIKLLAGGQTLIPTLKQRLAMPDALVDLGRIEALKGIRTEGDSIVIGARTTHAEVAASEEVRAAIPALARLAGLIGDPQVRNRGTIGGSVANADPAADYPAAVVGLGATIHTNQRTIPGDSFFEDLFTTALDDNELITAVAFPIPQAAAYEKFANPASGYAVVGVMVAKTAGGPRVGVTGAGPCAFRAPALEEALAGAFTPEAAKGVSMPATGLNADIHASAEYRAALISVLASRAVAAIG
ncbi:xanthine dehydrogenase family protein subunit M [Roseospira marina]|uniref:Xanthine dehydrogenase family protein subunit M n=1 Tax=Roseospira marina TaxID=140057 RepID=A0A5M6I9U5_9PROT|nr:xanthine dehydrogenase family protein subunit M [Roseospira marina]KAA5604953.1 xanthine dehydrogenase family protein subunit M [Roseospira marina]MBB4315049.1 carbon-monoxide dehydrogenase medium subunit [Roseospira marina]MBB5088049.1 carbon-monoxide dehydrogenase medium subunit [Roseospira marina]